MFFFREELAPSKARVVRHSREGGNPLLKFIFKITVSLRASTCSTRRKYVPVPKALASLMGQALGLTPASMLATVVQAATRMHTCLFASFDTEMEKVYG
jgi:hypothetical protein